MSDRRRLNVEQNKADRDNGEKIPKRKRPARKSAPPKPGSFMLGIEPLPKR